MKNLLLSMSLLIALVSCDSPNRNGNVYVNNQPAQDVYVTPEVSNLGDNLDLQALGELVKTAKNAQDLENQLNVSGSINNLDLDGDGKVDYIKVTEYGDGNTKGFSFTVDLANGEQQEVATVEIQKNNDQQVAMNINGNNQIYGNNSSYASNYSLADLMIMSYLFSPHSVYYSPYHYGYYPSYYHSYSASSYNSYSSRVKTVTKTTKITRTSSPRTTKVKSPNSNLSSKSVNTRAKSFSNPTRSQKSFSKTSPSNSRPNTSGFGSTKKSNPSYKNSSSSKSFGSSSRSSSRSGFGSSSRSSSRSSSSRRR